MGQSIITGETLTPVLYCDIDGTIRKGKDELGYFVNEANDVQVFETVPSLLRLYKDAGWRIVGISNQGGVALGYVSFDTCAMAMIETQKQTGDAFDRIQWCIHHPDADIPEMSVCWCRKPRIGSIVEAALDMSQHFGEIYPPHMALFIGDMEDDRLTAENAGIRFMWAKEWREGKHIREII